MQTKLLQTLVEELAGENSSRIVKILFNKKDVNEFLIARKMDLTINQVRNILYKLSAEGLVSFIRKKDNRKGWYIYYWTLNTEKCLIRLKDSTNKKINGLEAQLEKRVEKNYYVCKSCNIEVGEETALEHNFSCEECAEVYELVNKEAPIKEIKMKIAKKQRNLKVIEQELEIVREKEKKKKARAEKKTGKEAKKKSTKKKEKVNKISKVKAKKSRKKMKKIIKKISKAIGRKKIRKSERR